LGNAHVLIEGVGLLAVEGEAEGPLHHEAVDPCAGVRVDTEVGEDRDRHGGVEVVKETGNIKEEDTSDIPISNGHLRFVAKECGSVRCGMVLSRPKLHAADEVEIALVCSKMVSNDFLEEFTCAFKPESALAVASIRSAHRWPCLCIPVGHQSA
jgi:hypothetical protein